MRRVVMATFLLILLAVSTFVVVGFAEEEKLVNKVIVMRITEDSPAIQSLEAGDTQARLFGIRSVDLVKKLEAEGFKVIAPLSGLVDILVNPVKCKDGSFNPFTIREVRYALNYLINRKEIVDKIYKGGAVPAYIPYADVDPDYVKLLPVAVKYEVEFSKGFEYAKKLITEAMEKAGAKLINGKWYYNGKPVVIKFVIRIEDLRKQVGDYVADLLEKLGFTVERIYKDFSGAYNIVYGDDPGKCGWHLYTEGWGFTGLTAYDHDTAIAFFSSLYGFLPGWGESSYTNYKPPKIIDEIAKRLMRGEYKNAKEYWQLYRKLVDLGIQDAVRIFVVWTRDYYVLNPKLTGIIESPKASPWNTWTYLNLHYVKDTVKFSNRYVYAPGWPWNPVGGFQDLYSVTSVANFIYLPGLTSKITTGEPGWSPFITYKVIRGPVKIEKGAITWDPKKHEWVSMAGKVAKNAVILNYKLLGKLKFHDGSVETIADLLAPIYLIKEWATKSGPNDTRYESPLASLYASFLSNFVAVKPLNSTAVIVYTNFTHIDDRVIAQNADIWASTPLELYVAMEQLVEHGDAAFTMSAAKAKKVPAVHLVSKDQCDKMAKYLEEMIKKREIPDWVKGLIKLGYLTEDEFFKRLENLLNFYKKYGHMLVGNGPFMLVHYDPANDVATLVRVKNYPISPEEIAKELAKHTAEITGVELAAGGIIISAGPGTKIATIKINVDGRPARSKDVRVYAFAVSTKGEVYPLEVKCKTPGVFEVYLGKALEPGNYKLVVYAYPTGYNEPAKYVGAFTLISATKTTTPPTTVTSTMTTTTTMTATKTITVTHTAAPSATTITVYKTTTITKTVGAAPKTVTVTSTVTRGAGTGMLVGAAIAALIIGFIIGYAVKRS